MFGHSVVTHPEACGHLLGQLNQTFGADHIIWGTDSIWWGSPQWQIEAMRRFQQPETLKEQFGYQDFTAAEKAQIFGYNIAGLFDVDVNAARNDIPQDLLASLKSTYIEAGADPSNTQYGWVAV